MKTLLAGVALLILAAGIYFGVQELENIRQRNQLHSEVRALLALSNAPAATNFEDRVDRVRTFINTHSVHNIDSEFYSMWRDRTVYAAAVLAYARQERSGKPHLECSTRSALMRPMLRAMGYRVRAVDIFNPDDNLASHTFLEVLNPDTGQWEIQDPDYDIVWKDKKTGQRASVAQLIAAPERYEPCSLTGCGFGHRNPEGMTSTELKPYLKIAAMIDKHAYRRSTIYGNGVDPGKTYRLNGRTGPFCTLIGKDCRDGFTPVAGYVDYHK